MHHLLSNLFPSCLKSKCIPSVWRHGTIVPIPKNSSSDPRIPLNYRGISLLCIPYKAFCTIINQHILEWSDERGILCEEQNGFRSNRSCLEHIFSLSSVVELRMQSKMSTFGCFIDFRKAYDNVKHDFLWKKLQNLGMPSQMLELLQCIYRDNTSCVKVNDYLSISLSRSQWACAKGVCCHQFYSTCL